MTLSSSSLHDINLFIAAWLIQGLLLLELILIEKKTAHSWHSLTVSGSWNFCSLPKIMCRVAMASHTDHFAHGFIYLCCKRPSVFPSAFQLFLCGMMQQCGVSACVLGRYRPLTTDSVMWQALMCGQGFDISDFLWTERDYRQYNKLAGNTVTTGVLGGLVIAVTFGALLKDDAGVSLGYMWVHACGCVCVCVCLSLIPGCNSNRVCMFSMQVWRLWLQ